jgi:hypothetical protein
MYFVQIGWKSTEQNIIPTVDTENVPGRDQRKNI